MPPCQNTKNKKRSDFLIRDSLSSSVSSGISEPASVASKKYFRCDSMEAFGNPKAKSATEINAELNLYLGQSLLNLEKNARLVKVIHFLYKFLISWWEHHLFRLWGKVPLPVRRKITFTAWKIYFPIHKFLLGRRTGIHPDVSLEYHALTTAMWGARFFPVSVGAMRFSLSQLTASHPTPLQSSVIEQIDEDCFIAPGTVVPDIQKDHCSVQGLYLPHRPNGSICEATEYTLLWFYGGAFIGGDALGNSGPADYIGSACGMDVFIPTYRLAPESNVDDLLWDTALAYRWLYLLRQKRGQDPTKILLFGCSSGAALSMRLVQFIAELERGEELLPAYVAGILNDVKMPAGAAIASPYVDFKPKDPDGSFLQYNKHDLIVTEPVQAVGLPYLETHMCGRKVDHSPVHRSLAGLPPFCVVVSEHETVYDESVELVNAARAVGVPVTVGRWKYMCHVWCFLSGFVPEGKDAMDFICEWYREQQQKCK